MTHGGEVIPSPNIWNHPSVYEAENRGVDRAGVIDAAMRGIHDWADQTVVDVGCGTGFHLAGFAGTAARVVGVEPHRSTAARARKRVWALAPALRDRIEVLSGTAQDLPLPATTADVAHARWAYFFGPGCEPGLRELARVVRRGGTAFAVDNDAARSTFGAWFRRALPRYDPAAIERFWARQGWQRVPLDITLEQPDRAAFEAVVRIEFPPQVADAVLADHCGSSVDCAVNLFWHRF